MEEQKTQPQQTEVKIEHGNIEVLKLQLLNRLVENTNEIIKLLKNK